MFDRCPNCHKFFAAKEINREIVHTEDFHANLAPNANAGMGNMRPVGSRIDKTIITYKVTYKCKYCGYEWNDFVEKGIG